MNKDKKSALVVGAGPGLSSALARLFHKKGFEIALAARSPEKLQGLSEELDARVFSCDASQRADVDQLFESVLDALGTPEIVIYNPSARVRGPFIDVDPIKVERALMITGYGAFLVAQHAARAMLERGHGAIFFTGASAGVKGYPQSASFAMGKFALRGLAQSMARELSPKNIHVAHFVIDGGIGHAEDDKLLQPESIAETYWHVYSQHRSAWAWEIELRPWVEHF